MPEKTARGLAVLECCQAIPCNPCTTACKTGAITKESLTSLPQFHPDKCVGCRLCVAACPGQAIFFVRDAGGEAEITFPYEYLPLPVPGQQVTATDRMGQPVCPAVVAAVDAPKAYNKTALVTLRVSEQYRDTVRFMKRLPREEVSHGG